MTLRIVFLSAALLAGALLSAAQAGERYDFPLKDGSKATNSLLIDTARTLAAAADLGIPDDPATMTPDEVKAVFGRMVKIADGHADVFAAKGTPLEYRMAAAWIARERLWNRLVERGTHEVADKAFMIPVVIPVHNAFIREDIMRTAAEAEIDAVAEDLDRHFANHVIAHLMDAGICRPEWGARALTRPGVGSGIEAGWWNLYLKTAGGGKAYEALAEAILNTPVELSVWAPGPADDLSWLSQYAIGYTQGFVPEEAYRAFLGRLKARALAAKGVYRVKGQKVYAALVDEWFVGGKDDAGNDVPPLIADFENL